MLEQSCKEVLLHSFTGLKVQDSASGVVRVMLVSCERERRKDAENGRCKGVECQRRGYFFDASCAKGIIDVQGWE